jgi:hypothetical protein
MWGLWAHFVAGVIIKARLALKIAAPSRLLNR